MGLDLHVPVEELSAYLDGELSVAGAADIERHLAECATCRDELAEFEGLRSLLGQLPQFESPRSFALAPGMLPPQAVANPHVVRLLPVMRVLSVAAVIAFLVVSVVTIFQVTSPGDSLTNDASLFETSGAPNASEDVTGDSAAGSGLIDRGDSAARNPAMAREPGGAAVDPDDQPESGAANADLAAPVASSVDATGSDDATGKWLVASLGLGVLTIVFGGIWWLLARMVRPQPQMLARMR